MTQPVSPQVLVDAYRREHATQLVRILKERATYDVPAQHSLMRNRFLKVSKRRNAGRFPYGFRLVLSYGATAVLSEKKAVDLLVKDLDERAAAGISTTGVAQ